MSALHYPSLAEVLAFAAPLAGYVGVRRPGRSRRVVPKVGVAAPPPTTPVTIMGANCIEWWRSDLGITLATGVSAWHGQVAGVDFLQGTAGAQPTYTASDATLNNRPSLLFDGTDDDLRSTLARSLPAVVWIIVKQVSWVGTETIIADATSSALVIRQSNSAPQIHQLSPTGVNLNGGLALGSWGRVQGEFTNSTSDRLLARSTNVTGANAGANTGTGPRIAVNAGSSAWGNIVVAEIALFNAVPSAGQNTSLDSYVTSLYGAGLV